MSETAVKRCRFCNTDVSGMARIKDKKGRYACQPCFERLKESRRIEQMRTEAKRSPQLAAFDPEIDTETLSIEVEHSVSTASQHPRSCPTCKAGIGAQDVVCINCGTNVQSGGRAKKVRIKKARVGTARSGNSGQASLIASVVFAAVLGAGMMWGIYGNPAVLGISLLLYFSYAGAVGILTVVAAFKEGGLLQMLLVWFLPFYSLYWVYGRAESGLLKLNFTLGLVLLIPYFMALSHLGWFKP